MKTTSTNNSSCHRLRPPLMDLQPGPPSSGGTHLAESGPGARGWVDRWAPTGGRGPGHASYSGAPRGPHPWEQPGASGEGGYFPGRKASSVGLLSHANTKVHLFLMYREKIYLWLCCAVRWTHPCFNYLWSSFVLVSEIQPPASSSLLSPYPWLLLRLGGLRCPSHRSSALSS